MGSAARLSVDIDPRKVELAKFITPSSGLITATIATRAIDCLSLMAREDLRHLPITMSDPNDLEGPQQLYAVLSSRDILAHFM